MNVRVGTSGYSFPEWKGNLFIGETYEGKRVQKFLYRGLGPAQTPLIQ